MDKTLNLPVLRDTLDRAGLNQSRLATKLNVSREAVSQWLKGEKFPQPDKLLRLGVALGLTFDQLVTLTAAPVAPVVSFRKKMNRRTTDEHLSDARGRGELLKRLVPYLPQQQFAHRPTLKNPTNDYRYVQQVAAVLRREMKLEGKPVIGFEDLIGKFEQLHAVIIPVLWGEQQYHGNALRIYLPDSLTTWVFLNLDSKAVDFKFWMAHELGHSLAPTLRDDAGEDFADSFAQALLFPEGQAAALREDLLRLIGIGARIERIRKEAHRHIISLFTIQKAVAAYEEAHGLTVTDFGPSFGGAATNFAKEYPTISEGLFKKQPPKPAEYIAVARSVFGSPFFEALADFAKHEEGTEHYLHRVLGVSLADAKALSGELRQ